MFADALYTLTHKVHALVRSEAARRTRAPAHIISIMLAGLLKALFAVAQTNTTNLIKMPPARLTTRVVVTHCRRFAYVSVRGDDADEAANQEPALTCNTQM